MVYVLGQVVHYALGLKAERLPRVLGVDWSFEHRVMVVRRNHPIDHLGRRRRVGRRRRWRKLGWGFERLRRRGLVGMVGVLLGLGEARLGMDGLFRCSRLGGRWRCVSNLRFRGRLSRRRG